MMIRTLKIMGSAMVALLAMSALVASSASAQFEAESAPITITPSSSTMQKFTLSPGAPVIECTTINGDYTPQEITATETLEFIPTISNCEPFLGASVTIKANGCEIVAHLAKGKTSGTGDIECPTGKTKEIIVGSICKYTVGTQTGLGTVNYRNVGSGTTREIEVEATVSGITTARTTNDLFCPAAGSNGQWQGSGTATAENAEGKHVGIWVD